MSDSELSYSELSEEEKATLYAHLDRQGEERIAELNKLEKEANSWKTYFLEHETSYKHFLKSLSDSSNSSMSVKAGDFLFMKLFVERGQDGKWNYAKNADGYFYKMDHTLHNLSEFDKLYSFNEKLEDYLNNQETKLKPATPRSVPSSTPATPRLTLQSSKPPGINEVIVMFRVKEKNAVSTIPNNGSKSSEYGLQIDTDYNNRLGYKILNKLSNLIKEFDKIYDGSNSEYGFTRDITKNIEKIKVMDASNLLQYPDEWSQLKLNKLLKIVPEGTTFPENKKPFFDFFMGMLGPSYSESTSIQNSLSFKDLFFDTNNQVQNVIGIIGKDIKLFDDPIGGPYKYYYKFVKDKVNDLNTSIDNISKIEVYKNICYHILKNAKSSITLGVDLKKQKDYLFVYLELFKAAATLISVVDTYTRLRFFYLLITNDIFKPNNFDKNEVNFVNIFVSTLSLTFTEIVFYRYSDSPLTTLQKVMVGDFIKKNYGDKITIDDFYEKYMKEVNIVLQKDEKSDKTNCINWPSGELIEACRSRIEKMVKSTGKNTILRNLWNTNAFEEIKGNKYSAILPLVETKKLLPFIFYANNFNMLDIIDYKTQRDYAFLLSCIQKYLIDKENMLGNYTDVKYTGDVVNPVATPRSIDSSREKVNLKSPHSTADEKKLNGTTPSKNLSNNPSKTGKNLVYPSAGYRGDNPGEKNKPPVNPENIASKQNPPTLKKYPKNSYSNKPAGYTSDNKSNNKNLNTGGKKSTRRTRRKRPSLPTP